MKSLIFSYLVILAITSVSEAVNVFGGRNGERLIANREACSEDYSPCSCFQEVDPPALIVSCDLVSIENIRGVFNRTTASDISRLILTLPEAVDTIPDNLIGDKRVVTLQLLSPLVTSGSQIQLKIEPNAFQSSRSMMENLYIISYDVRQLNFSFLTGFNLLKSIGIYDSTLLDRLQPLPVLPGLKNVAIEKCPSFGQWDLFSLLPPLQEIVLTDDNITDDVIKMILEQILLSPSADTLEILVLSNNLMTQVPSSLSSIVRMNRLSLAGNPIRNIPTGSFIFDSSTAVQELFLSSMAVENIETNAFQGNFSNAYVVLRSNNLRRFDESVFGEMLNQMVQGTGRIALSQNPFDCDCGLAWLIRDNRQFLRRLELAVCSDNTPFDQLDPNQFIDCPLLQMF